ncbi:F-box only protein 47-like, partial [Rhipicephalus sanguineus]
MCSKFMRDQVLGYLSCPTALEVLSFEHMEQVDAIRHCRSLGVLMKRVTFLFPIMARLRTMLPFIEKFVGRPKLNLNEPEQDLDATCRRWHQYGAFVMNAILGWRDSDCDVVYSVLVGLLRTRLFTARVLGARCGYLLHEEFVLRNFLQCLFLSEVVLDQRCAWLSRLLQRWPTVLRARLLFIIYGPCHHGEILWALPAHPHTTAWSPLLRVALAEMGAALASLYWSLGDTIDIIEELFVMCREWLPLNRAMLLTYCGVDICVTVIASKIRERHEDEVAGLLYNLIL